MLSSPLLADAAPPEPAPSSGPAASEHRVVTPASAEGHLGRLQELLRLATAPDEIPRQRRARLVCPRQRLQQAIRQEAVACYRALHAPGLTLAQCGQMLHLAPRTLRAWDAEGRPETLGLVPVGATADALALAGAAGDPRRPEADGARHRHTDLAGAFPGRSSG